jgi:hypothetical protein
MIDSLLARQIVVPSIKIVAFDETEIAQWRYCSALGKGPREGARDWRDSEFADI